MFQSNVIILDIGPGFSFNFSEYYYLWYVPFELGKSQLEISAEMPHEVEFPSQKNLTNSDLKSSAQ